MRQVVHREETAVPAREGLDAIGRDPDRRGFAGWVLWWA